MIWQLEGDRRVIDFHSRTQIMGILNITPDSFYDGSRFCDVDQAVDKALQMEADGADVVDVGGESSRPPMYGAAAALTAAEESRRVLPVIEKLRHRSEIPISVDTTKAEVARAALSAGADIVNDISALTADAGMAAVVAERQAPVILMHRRGTSATMQLDTHYDDLIGEVLGFLEKQQQTAVAAGVSPTRIAADPGLGFGKGLGDNFRLLRELAAFRSLGCPLVVGASRKSFLWKPLGLSPENCLEPSLAAAALAVVCGASMVRVHDVIETRRAVRIAEAVMATEKRQGPSRRQEEVAF